MIIMNFKKWKIGRDSVVKKRGHNSGFDDFVFRQYLRCLDTLREYSIFVEIYHKAVTAKIWIWNKINIYYFPIRDGSVIYYNITSTLFRPIIESLTKLMQGRGHDFLFPHPFYPLRLAEPLLSTLNLALNSSLKSWKSKKVVLKEPEPEIDPEQQKREVRLRNRRKQRSASEQRKPEEYENINKRLSVPAFQFPGFRILESFKPFHISLNKTQAQQAALSMPEEKLSCHASTAYDVSTTVRLKEPEIKTRNW